jgi:hypothetical protein
MAHQRGFSRLIQAAFKVRQHVLAIVSANVLAHNSPVKRDVRR